MLAYIRDERVQGGMEVGRKRKRLIYGQVATRLQRRVIAHISKPTFRSGDRSVSLLKAGIKYHHIIHDLCITYTERNKLS
jgi:hypothetical protein